MLRNQLVFRFGDLVQVLRDASATKKGWKHPYLRHYLEVLQGILLTSGDAASVFQTFEPDLLACAQILCDTKQGICADRTLLFKFLALCWRECPNEVEATLAASQEWRDKLFKCYFEVDSRSKELIAANLAFFPVYLQLVAALLRGAQRAGLHAVMELWLEGKDTYSWYLLEKVAFGSVPMPEAAVRPLLESFTICLDEGLQVSDGMNRLLDNCLNCAAHRYDLQKELCHWELLAPFLQRLLSMLGGRREAFLRVNWERVVFWTAALPLKPGCALAAHPGYVLSTSLFQFILPPGEPLLDHALVALRALVDFAVRALISRADLELFAQDLWELHGLRSVVSPAARETVVALACPVPSVIDTLLETNCADNWLAMPVRVRRRGPCRQGKGGGKGSRWRWLGLLASLDTHRYAVVTHIGRGGACAAAASFMAGNDGGGRR
jgi:hypothetical protein